MSGVTFPAFPLTCAAVAAAVMVSNVLNHADASALRFALTESARLIAVVNSACWNPYFKVPRVGVF